MNPPRGRGSPHRNQSSRQRLNHVDAKYNPNGSNVVDLGLGAVVKNPKENGKFKVPTLRNVALTASYMHKGPFKTLDEVAEFYNSRDKNKRWGKPEMSENVDYDELGDLKLTSQEVKDIVAFMNTLTDGY